MQPKSIPSLRRGQPSTGSGGSGTTSAAAEIVTTWSLAPNASTGHASNTRTRTQPQDELLQTSPIGDTLLSSNVASLTERQQEAVLSALTHKVTVITGGPGTGKTTTLQTLCELADAHDVSLALTAPTGRAAKRLSDVSRIRPTRCLRPG